MKEKFIGLPGTLQLSSYGSIASMGQFVLSVCMNSSSCIARVNLPVPPEVY